MTYLPTPPIPAPPARYMQVNAPSVIQAANLLVIPVLCGAQPTDSAGDIPYILGCAIKARGKVCVIIVPNERTWPYDPADRQKAIDHEQGHCNGWPSDHPE